MMKFALVSVLAGLLAIATAQFQGLPQCAQGCLTSGLPKNCGNLDIGCICHERSWIDNLSCCISKTCNPSDQATTVQFAQQICKTANVDLGNTSAHCPDSATSSMTGSATGSAASAMASTTGTSAGTTGSTSTSRAGAASTGGVLANVRSGIGAAAAGVAALVML